MDLPLRPLLLDCRIELRKLIRNFDKTELCARLDAAMAAVAQQSYQTAQAARTAEKAAAAAAPPAPSDRTAQQVAYAWQSACRTLKASHPPVHEALHAEVLRLLDLGHYTDPAAEIDHLKRELADAEQQLQTLKLAKMKLQAQLGALHKALATALPDVPEGSDPQGTALQRISALASGRHVPAAPWVGPQAAAGVAAPAPAAVSLDAVPPPPQVLERVKAGERQFTKAQRDFVVGEALVVTGWQFTPVELLERGEPWLAALLLDHALPH